MREQRQHENEVELLRDAQVVRVEGGGKRLHAELVVLSPAVRVEAFYSAIEGHVLPRLARLGVDGDSAWQRRYRGD